MPRILIADDERSMQEFLEILLQRDGYETTCCDSAETALNSSTDVVFTAAVCGARNQA